MRYAGLAAAPLKHILRQAQDEEQASVFKKETLILSLSKDASLDRRFRVIQEVSAPD